MSEKTKQELYDSTIKLIQLAANASYTKALEYQEGVAKALTTPLRQAILSGDNLGNLNIYEPFSVPVGTAPEWPLDPVNPGDEGDFVAYTWNGHGRIPERQIEGGYVTIPTYSIASSVDWLLRHAREAQPWLVNRAMQVLKYGFVKKMNDDGWHTLISAAVDRNILVYDADASAGQFTKRLVSLAKTVMRRNGGGNSNSLNRKRLTDLFVSPEAMEDMRNWGVDQVDEITRREIYTAADGSINRIFNVNLHDMDEFGVGQEYQTFYTDVLGATLQGSDVELCVGLDLSATDSFVMPVKQNVTLTPDPNMHRAGKAGVYGTAELGFGALDNRNAILLSF